MLILALEVQQHMLKKVNNACPNLPFTHIKAMVNLDTTVFRFIEIFFLLLAKNKTFCMCNKQLCMHCHTIIGNESHTCHGQRWLILN